MVLFLLCGVVCGGSVECCCGVCYYCCVWVVEVLGGVREIRRYGRRVGDRVSVRRVRLKVFIVSGFL